MGMLSTWFLFLAPVHRESIEMVFPIVGHSFLPADRIFARIEKEMKKKMRLLVQMNIQTYFQILELQYPYLEKYLIGNHVFSQF